MNQQKDYNYFKNTMMSYLRNNCIYQMMVLKRKNRPVWPFFRKVNDISYKKCIV